MTARVIVENLDEQFLKRIKEIEKSSEELYLEYEEVSKEKRHCETMLIELFSNIKERYGFENASCLRFDLEKKQLLSYSGQVLVPKVDDNFVTQLEKHAKLEKQTDSDLSFIRARINVLDAKSNNLSYDIKAFYKLEKIKGILFFDSEKKQILLAENREDVLREDVLKEMFMKDLADFLKSLRFKNFEP